MMGEPGISRHGGAKHVPRDWTGHAGLRPPTESDTTRLLDMALDFCSLRSGKTAAKVLDLVLGSDVWANSTLRYAIAKEICQKLKADPKVRGLYILGSVMEDQARLDSDVDLVLHVEAGKSDYENWLVLLDQGLVSLFRERFGLGDAFTRLLDCHVVTDMEVSEKTGYGSLLTSAHAQLTRIS